jgi:hypothetical protein
MEALLAEIENLEVQIQMAWDDDEAAQLQAEVDYLRTEYAELEEAVAEQAAATAEIEQAKAQAAEAQAIAEDLASGSEEALQRVKVNAKKAYDKATADLTEAVARADTLNAQIAEKEDQINFM